MSSNLIGKRATVEMEKMSTVSFTGEIIEYNEYGILVEHVYWGRKRLELVPHSVIRRIFVDDKATRTRGEKALAKKAPEQMKTTEELVTAMDKEEEEEEVVTVDPAEIGEFDEDW